MGVKSSYYMYTGLLQSLLYITLLLIEYTNCYSDYGDSNQFGIMDLFELDSLQYEVEILPLPIKKEDMSKGTDKSSLVMTSKHGQQYHCVLPEETILDNGYRKLRPYMDIADLLKPLRGNCLLVNEGWWSYKYCHGDSVMQFHIEGGSIIGDVVYLGYYDNEKSWNEESLKKAMDLRIKNRGNSIMKLPSHDVQYTEGNICSLINQPRSVTAKMICSPYHTSSEIIEVIEQETYNRIGLTSIQCSPILSQHKYERYMKSFLDKNSQPSEEEDDDSSKTNDVDTETPEDQKQDTIPLLNVLELLSDSIVSKMTEVTINDENNEDGSDDDEISKELNDVIDELVTESLNKVFGITESKDKSKHSEEDSVNNPESPTKRGETKERGNREEVNSEGMDNNNNDHQKKESAATQHGQFGRMTIVKKEQRETDRDNADDTSKSSSGLLVLASMLQDILNDEYSAESRNDKDGHKFEKKRKKLEDRYENNWELDEENGKDDSPTAVKGVVILPRLVDDPTDKDGFLTCIGISKSTNDLLFNDEYSAESRNDKDGHKFEKKRKKLEDRYENNWELDEENEKD